MPKSTSDPKARELRLQVLRYMECCVARLDGKKAEAMQAEMRSIRAVTGLSHDEIVALGTEILLEEK